MTMKRSTRRATKVQLAGIAFLSILTASIADHAVAGWIRRDVRGGGTGSEIGIYRRIGPKTGPQVFGAGSSLLEFDLSWGEVSAFLGQGIEKWGVAGSSPDIWEISQRVATNANLMIIGVSVYDLNELHLSAVRARIVPLAQTIRDLWDSGADWQFSRRLLGQYQLRHVRRLFPTAGDSDAVLVGLRTKVRERLNLASAAQDREGALFLPSEPVLEFGKLTARVSDWPAARLLRRLALLSAENGGRHAFNGPKRLAFHRMLRRAQQQGRVIVVVLPVAQAYVDTFLTPDVVNRFEQALTEAFRIVPEARVIRLDQVQSLTSHDYSFDLVHLNSAGRRIATAAFLSKLQERSE
jgi:hypothetical protein